MRVFSIIAVAFFTLVLAAAAHAEKQAPQEPPIYSSPISPAMAEALDLYKRGYEIDALKITHAEATKGDPVALVNLGYMYSRGDGVRRSEEQARRLYEQAAERGEAAGINAIGWQFEYLEEDYEEAAKWYQKAVNKGSVQGMNNLAGLYLAGRGVKPNYKKTEELWLKSAKLGHANSMYNLGMFYVYGPPAHRNLEKAITWWRKCVDKGPPYRESVRASMGELERWEKEMKANH